MNRVIAAALVLLSTTAASAETVGKILATIDGAPVTTWEVKQFMIERTRGQEIPGDVRPDSPQVLDAFITEKLIQKEISDQGIVVTDADVDRYVEGIRVQNKLTLERLKAAVEAQGMSWEGYRAQVREEMQKAQLINKEIRGKVNVTPEEIQRYYEAHKSEFVSQGTQVHVRHLMLPLPPGAGDDEVQAAVAKAKTLRDGIDDVDDFAQVAKDEAGDEAGGDLGYLDPDSMQDDLGDAVKKLSPGEVSEPVVISGAVHLVMVEDVKEGEDEPVDQFSEQIKQKLYSEAIEGRYERWLREDLRLRHYVDIRP
jgi:peptidyl-prolyl cis-trans isomerase SurA